MFEFKLEGDIPLLTAVRTGFWSLATVAQYELALRRELTALHLCGPSPSFIIDIGSTGAQPKDVAEALRAMVGRLGALKTGRNAIVSEGKLAKLQARHAADESAGVFPSMALARDWVSRPADSASDRHVIYDEPSDAEAEGATVRVHGPSDIDINLTPGAALETAKRIEDAAIDALIGSHTSAAPP